ncbi:hypothetical protein LL946_06330 [Knoellia locipacati]|uniref:hypothetical protein n=1 Tax=Knoellia locipacati TaxID=882824 RepID=UPI00384B01E7
MIEQQRGIPAYTVSVSGAVRGEIAFTSIAALIDHPTLKNLQSAKDYLRRRAREGTTLIPGLLPLRVSNINLPGGERGPWRDPWCWSSIEMELTALRDACAVIITGFTGMRDGEVALLPTQGWRTTWHGSAAIEAPSVKTAAGDNKKWWAVPAVTQACEILANTAAAGATYMLATGEVRHERTVGRQGPKGVVDESRTLVHTSIQRFLAHIDTNPALRIGFGIPAAFAYGNLSSDDGETITPHRLRLTLSSIANFSTLGDAALNQQLQHARIQQTWSYMANGETDSWRDHLVVADAAEANSRVLEVLAGVWAGDRTLAGLAGPKIETAFTALLDDEQISPPVTEQPVLAQFRGIVADSPVLLAFARSVSESLYLGVTNHCYYDASKSLCGGTDGPVLARCQPEACSNVVLDGEQQAVYADLRDEVEEILSMPRLPSGQKVVLRQRMRSLERMLGDAP